MARNTIITPNIAAVQKMMEPVWDDGRQLILLAALALNCVSDPTPKIAKDLQKAVDSLFLAQCCIRRVFELSAPPKATKRQDA